MPNVDLERAEYIRALLRNKKNTIAQGGNLLNPALNDDISGLAALDNSFAGVRPQVQPETNLKKEQKQNGFDSFMNNVLGFVDEMAAKFGSGFVNGWEGILDFGATAIGALGDKTGWYSGKTFTDWAKQDIGAAASEWTKTAFGLGSWYNRARGKTDANEWEDIGKSFLDWNKAAFFAKNDLGDLRTELTDKHYKARDDLETTVGQFLGGAAHSIGFMLPSIMTAGAGAAAGAGQAGQQAISLATLGAGAAGKGSEEALNEGAESGKALAYGTASGAVEVASELVVGKALGLVGLGTGKVAGVVGKGTAKTTAKTGSKIFASNLIKTMNEEGMEEVFSAVMEPVLKSIYQGDEAYKDSKGKNKYFSGEFWFGEGGHFNESVLGQYASGAFVGGLSGGMHESAVYKKLGENGYVAFNSLQNMSEADAKMAKLEYQNKTDGKAYQTAQNERGEALIDFIKAVDKLLANGTEAQKKAFAEAMSNPKAMAKWKEEDGEDINAYINERVEGYRTEKGKVDVSHEYGMQRDWLSEMNHKLGTNAELIIERGEIKTDSNGVKQLARIDGNKIYINENVFKSEGGKKLAHEYMAHHLVESLPKEIRSSLFNAAKRTAYYEENEEALKKAYADEYENDRAKFNEEVFANAIEYAFTEGNTATQLENMRQVLGKKGFFSALQRMLRGAKKFDSPELVKIYTKTLDKFAKEMQKAKIYDREAVGDFINKIEELKTQPAYSKTNSTTEQIKSNLMSRYNDFLSKNPEATGIVASSGEYLVLFDNNNFDITIRETFKIGNLSRVESNYLKSLFKIGENYDGRQFIKLLRQGIKEIGRYRRGIEGNDVSSYEHRGQRNSNETSKDGNKGDNQLSSKEVITGKYTVGDNKKKLEVRKALKGYEVIYPDDVVLDQEQSQKKGRDIYTGRTITDAVINGEKVSFITNSEKNNEKNIKAYIKDIKAKKVEYEKKTKQPPLSKPESIEVKNAPSEAEMRKADETPVKKKYKIYIGATIYASDDLGKTTDVFKIIKKGSKEGSFVVDVKDSKTAEIKTQELTRKALNSRLSSYTNVSNNEKNLQTVQKNRTVLENKTKNEEKEVKETTKPKKAAKKDKNVLKTDKVVENEKGSQKADTKSVYKSLSTTKEIIDKTISSIEQSLGEGYKVIPPVNMQDFTWRTFNDINKVQDIDKEASRLVNKMLETTVYTNEKEYVGLSELLSDEQIEELKADVKELIESSPNSKARSRSAREYQVRSEMLMDMVREFKHGQGRGRVAVRLRDAVRRAVGRYHELTGNRITRDGLYALYDAFKELSGVENGTFSAKHFRDNLESTLEWYTEEGVARYEGLPYNQRVRNAIEAVFNALGMPVEKGNGTVSKNVMSDAMQKSIDAMRVIKEEIDKMYKKSADTYLPASLETINAMKNSKYARSRNLLAHYFRMYKRGFAPTYVVLEEMLGGNSQAARKLIYDMQNNVNKKTLYTGAYSDLINKKLKELGIKKTFDTKKVSIRGHELTIDQAMGLYISTQVQTNYDAIEKDGVKFYDSKYSQTVELAKSGEAQALKNEANNVLPKEYKELADWLLSVMNDSVKKEYIEWYKNKFGDYNMRNEIGDIQENTYWTLNRSYQKATNLSKAVTNPDAIFSNAIRRVDNDNAVLITGALGSFDAYINKMGRELYIKPVYEDAIQILNAKFRGGESIAEFINNRADGGKDFQFLKNAMEDMLGVNQREANMLDKMVSAFSVAKLSLNIGSMMKQFASAFTSNIPIKQTAKALIARWSPEARTEFKKLVDEIGGLKYREASKGVLKANADSLGKVTEKIADVGMIGISKVDMFTVSTGVYSLMVIGQNQFKAKIGTQANIDFVKEHWVEYELSQIGNTPLSKNMISKSDGVARYLFGFLQGANRAALGSQIHKIGLWLRNRKVNEQQLKDELKRAKEVAKQAKADYEANEDDEVARRAYIEAEAKVLEFENKIKDFESYKIAGGKAIPVNMASGLIAQGILVALVNALMKRLKGKKDWEKLSEVDWAEEALALAMSTGVDWVPMVNFISNLMQGYEVTIPAVEIFNKMSDIFSNGKNGNFRSMIREIALLVGDMTGIPFQTIYDYIYGALKTFDPAIAFEMRSVVYGSSLQSATKTMQTYAEKGKEDKTASMVGLIMNKFKTGSTTDEINEELAILYISGNSAIPKTAMTQYTDEDGNTIKLTDTQIKQFTDIYSRSTKDVSKLMNLTEYRSMTNEEKAKAIKKLYDAYYSFAKAKVVGGVAEGKLGQMLALTNGNVELAKYIISLQKVAQIAETTKKTRKELVIQYINRLKGYTKAEKAFIMYLAGYSVKGTSANLLQKFLINKGASRQSVKNLLS